MYYMIIYINILQIPRSPRPNLNTCVLDNVNMFCRHGYPVAFHTATLYLFIIEKTNKQKMIIIEEGWEHAIRVYISFLTTDTSFERHNGAKVSFKYDTSIPF